jgi:adenylyl-sulfate kinase
MLHVHPTRFKVSKANRAEKFNQTPRLIWFTGLSGSGKSTLANALEFELFNKGYSTYLMDGDNVRTGLCKDLSFSIEDRIENIRRISEVANLMLDAGLIILSAFISPFIADREMIAKLVGTENFMEVYVDCPIEVCEARDVKGLYQKARQGLIPNFTGIDSPYEPPPNPFITIKTHELSLGASLEFLFEKLEPKIIY